jgi:hypothetical protein
MATQDELKKEIAALAEKSIRSLLDLETDPMKKIWIYNALEGIGFYQVMLKEKKN